MRYLALALAVGTGTVWGLAVRDAQRAPAVTVQVNRVCEEDEVIVGVGDFDGTTWDAYVCRNFD